MSDPFLYLPLSRARAVLAPDGSLVRELPRVTGPPGGGMAHCTLGPGRVSRPVRHRTVDEVWFVLGGRAEFWRTASVGGDGSGRSGVREDLRELEPEDSLRIVAGTAFQFRTLGAEPFRALLLTVPEWPGDDEAVQLNAGRWSPR